MMALGPLVRSLFGRHEARIAALYRALYFDLDDYLARIIQWAPEPRRILEIGCGEGAVTERLAGAYPQAEILATDISERLGRLYQGRSDGVRFVRATAAEIATAEAGAFDLVLFTDVLHHVPKLQRSAILADAARALAPGGTLIVKEWARRPTPIHWLCYASDRWLTGDRIAYMRAAELRALLARSLPAATCDGEARLRPWRNNLTIALRPGSDASALVDEARDDVAVAAADLHLRT